jgi:hypothetical protein
MQVVAADQQRHRAKTMQRRRDRALAKARRQYQAEVARLETAGVDVSEVLCRTARQQLEPDGGSQPEPEPEPELEPKPETEPEPSQTQQQHTGGAGEAAGDKPDDDDDDDGGGGTFVLTAVRGALFLLFSDSSFRAVIMTGNSPTSISHLLLPHDSTEGATPCRRSRRRSTSRSRKSKHRSRRRSRCSTWPSICRCRPETCHARAGQSAPRRSSSCTRRARRVGIGPC